MSGVECGERVIQNGGCKCKLHQHGNIALCGSNGLSYDTYIAIKNKAYTYNLEAN
jgi:hypothetical protein